MEAQPGEQSGCRGAATNAAACVRNSYGGKQGHCGRLFVTIRHINKHCELKIDETVATTFTLWQRTGRQCNPRSVRYR